VECSDCQLTEPSHDAGHADSTSDAYGASGAADSAGEVQPPPGDATADAPADAAIEGDLGSGLPAYGLAPLDAAIECGNGLGGLATYVCVPPTTDAAASGDASQDE